MHYVGFVFLKDVPTEASVKEAMEPFEGKHWDWWRPGGRWDGYFGGEDEMKRRGSEDGFNFDKRHESVERNFVPVLELGDKVPFFFVSDGDWVPRDYWNEYEPSDVFSGSYGKHCATPDFDKRFAKAKEEFKDGYVVVVDVHN